MNIKKSVTTWYYNNLIVWFFILPITIIGLSSIIAYGESTPSVAEGKAALIAQIAIQKYNVKTRVGKGVNDVEWSTESWSKCLKVVSFDKTNAIAGEGMYQMEYSAQVEIICSPCSGRYDSKAKQIYLHGNTKPENDMSGTPDSFPLGSKFEVTGEIMFQKTENGWRVSKY